MADGSGGVERVPWPQTLRRGLVRRCGRCGGRGIFAGWFRLRERCPTCGYRFVREEGAFTGVYLLNFGVTLALLFVALMGFVVQRSSSGSDGALWPILALTGAIAVVVPVVIYPVCASTWAALDLASRPLEPSEEAEAATWLASRED